MADPTPRFLFVPVSGPFGMGEYARSLAIAQAAAARWPGAALHFILSRKARYAARVPYPATLLSSSPTFHSAAVIRAIRDWRPDIVVFDNAGRTAQLRAAGRCGAHVIYISARRRQRRKAFRLRWMRLIDEHWIAYPEFVAGALSIPERLKLRLLGKPRVRYLDVVLAPAGDSGGESILARCGFAARSYALVVPGGGTGHPGARNATALFHEVAARLAASGVATVFVGADAPASAPSGSNLRMFGALHQSELVQLMRAARVIICNGGSTLLQSIACAKPCVAAPVASDQAERIAACAASGVALGVALEAPALFDAARALLGDEALLESLARRSAALGLSDGIEIALDAIAGLLAARSRGFNDA